MLRSLVGSEMCIRDRGKSGNGGLGGRGFGNTEVDNGHVTGIGTIGKHVLQSSGLHLLRGCLLYTSDAADDLLCVDLGGRRIIKKKNKRKKV